MLALGRLEDVASRIAVAQRLDPLEGLQVGLGHYVAGGAEFHLGNVDAAYDRMRKAVAANPSLVQGWTWIAAIDALQGRQAEAVAAVNEVRRRRPNLRFARLSVRASAPPRHGFKRASCGSLTV